MQEEAQIKRIVQATVEKFSRIDYAVNCAGELRFQFQLFGGGT